MKRWLCFRLARLFSCAVQVITFGNNECLQLSSVTGSRHGDYVSMI
jgi:hypothetical protein